MAVILSLETSAATCSVALHEDGRLKKNLTITESQAHASKLALLIKQVIPDLKEIDAVAVSSGPGSYTGLRIGVSTAKGICYALNKPLIAINTLDLLMAQFKENSHQVADGYLCPMIDAKRMEVYCQVYDQEGEVIKSVEALTIEELSFNELLKEHKMFFFGDGSEKCEGVIVHPNAYVVKGYVPDASVLGQAAHQKFLKREFEDLISFVPFYLKDFIAKKAPSVF
jgi:tRNA threonylcarbamoyladenosine biosynthesis protein TsaB